MTQSYNRVSQLGRSNRKQDKGYLVVIYFFKCPTCREVQNSTDTLIQNLKPPAIVNSRTRSWSYMLIFRTAKSHRNASPKWLQQQHEVARNPAKYLRRI